MMDHMIGGVMMLGMGVLGLLVIIVLVLSAAALVKYLFFGKSRRAREQQPAEPPVLRHLRLQ